MATASSSSSSSSSLLLSRLEFSDTQSLSALNTSPPQLSLAAAFVRRHDVGLGLREPPPALLEGRLSARHPLPHLRLQGHPPLPLGVELVPLPPHLLQGGALCSRLKVLPPLPTRCSHLCLHPRVVQTPYHPASRGWPSPSGDIWRGPHSRAHGADPRGADDAQRVADRA